MAKWREIPIADVQTIRLENGDTMPAADFFAACRGPVVSNVKDIEGLVRNMLTRAVEEDCMHGQPKPQP